MKNKVIKSLWIGDQLSRLEQLCIKSFLYHGHEFHLYTSLHSNEELDIKNPFYIDDKWEIKDKKLFDNDQLIILENKEKCLQES